MKKKTKKSAPRGSNLYWRADREAWYWRRVDPRTGKRLVRATDQSRIDLAMRVAARFEDELRAELAGIKSFEEWRAELRPLAERWLERQKGEIQERTLAQKRSALLRALEDLRLRVASDLTDLAALDDRLRALERTRRASRQKLRRAYQQPLREFSRWLAGNGRYLERDPLATWEPIPLGRSRRAQPRRAFLPHEVGRALLALDILDGLHGRAVRQRTLFTAMLVVAPRASAMAERDVRDFDRQAGRIDLGKDVGHKHRGAGLLDPVTADEIAQFLGERKDGPLFPAPSGARHDLWRMLDAWREAFSLGLVEELWPARGEAWSLELAVLVNRALLRGVVRVGRGGNPKRTTTETKAALAKVAGRVEALTGLLRDDWTERMAGVDDHAFRMTHRTWAEASGNVPPVLIDRQLGHAGAQVDRSMDSLRLLAGSLTGRKHYLDRSSPLLDPRRSGLAVRELLDAALAELTSSGPGRSRLLPPAEGQTEARA